MTRTIMLLSTAAAGGLLAFAPARASAQSWGVYVDGGYPRRDHYDPYYAQEARREHWREEQRERWEAHERWERERAERAWNRERWERRREWRGSEDDDD